MQLSIVDTSQVTAGRTAVEALAATVDLARLADRTGFARYWLAEHHGAGQTNASRSPEAMIARVGSVTDRIRIGSGAVLLNHHSAFRVAETFRLLHAMLPGHPPGPHRRPRRPATVLPAHRRRLRARPGYHRHPDHGLDRPDLRAPLVHPPHESEGHPTHPRSLKLPGSCSWPSAWPSTPDNGGLQETTQRMTNPT